MPTDYLGFNAEDFLRDVLGAKNITRNGPQLVHSCVLPFGIHKNGDANPSAALNTDLLLYNCFTCGGGSLIWLVQTVLDVTSAEAKNIIQKNLAPTSVTKEQFLSGLGRAWTEEKEEDYSMPEYSEVMLRPWLRRVKYLDERGISEEVQKAMKTGVNPDNLDRIESGDEEWINQPRLVIPHFFGGKLRGWSMRKLDDRQAGPKYRHTPSFPKERTLYNYDSAVRDGVLIVVESPMSVLKLMSLGFENVVATFGAQVNPRQVDLLRDFESIIIFPDGDSAGYAATEKLVKALSSTNKVWIVDHGLDDSGFNRKDAADYTLAELDELFNSKTPSYLWRYHGHNKKNRSKDRPKYASGKRV